MLSLLLLHLLLAGARLLTGRLQGVQDKWDAFWWCQCRYQPHPSGLMARSLLFNPLYLLLMHYPSLQRVLLLWDLILSTLSGRALFSPLPVCLMRWCISLSSNFPEQRRRFLGAHLNWKQDQIWPDPPLALISSNFSCWNDKLYQNKLSKELWWFTLAVDLALWRYPEYISINIISLQAPQHQLFLSCFINIHLKEDRPLKKNKTRNSLLQKFCVSHFALHCSPDLWSQPHKAPPLFFFSHHWNHPGDKCSASKQEHGPLKVNVREQNPLRGKKKKKKSQEITNRKVCQGGRFLMFDFYEYVLSD